MTAGTVDLWGIFPQKVLSFRIPGAYKIPLFKTAPTFYSFFGGDGVADTLKFFDKKKMLYIVLLSKPINFLLFVLG